MTPRVSVIIVNWFHPEIIDVCLRQLTITDYLTLPYEVIVVDNGSDPATVEALVEHRNEGRIDKLLLEPVNHMFSVGNNIGFAASDPDSEYVLLLNSDVAVMRPDWLTKLVAWADGTVAYWPSVWGLNPTEPEPGPYDFVSYGFSFDATVQPSKVRPEGWCLLIRREWWRDMSPDLPWKGGMEEAVAHQIRAGARCGVLSQYSTYVVHREGGSTDTEPPSSVNGRPVDFAGWFNGCHIETLDFTLGPEEHSSYLAF